MISNHSKELVWLEFDQKNSSYKYNFSWKHGSKFAFFEKNMDFTLYHLKFLIFNDLSWMGSWLVEPRLATKWKRSFQSLTHTKDIFLGDFGEKSYRQSSRDCCFWKLKTKGFLRAFLGYFGAIIRLFWTLFRAINMVLRVCMSSIGLGKCLGMIKNNFGIFCQKNPKNSFFVADLSF